MAPRLIASLVVVGAVGCVRGPSLESYVIELHEHAGGAAQECGVVHRGQPPASALNCAKAALVAKRPFFVSFQVMGIDSQVYVGLVLTKQGATELGTWDSDVWGGSRLWTEHKTSWRECLSPALSVTDGEVDVACGGE